MNSFDLLYKSNVNNVLLREYCPPNQKLEFFVLYIKIINTFFFK